MLIHHQHVALYKASNETMWGLHNRKCNAVIQSHQAERRGGMFVIPRAHPAANTQGDGVLGLYVAIDARDRFKIDQPEIYQSKVFYTVRNKAHLIRIM